MKERFEEAKPITTVLVGMVTGEVYQDEGNYSDFIVGDAFFGSFRTIEEGKIGFTMGGASRNNRSRKGNTL